MGKLPLFLLKVAIPAYLIITLFLYVVAMTDFFVGGYRGTYKTDKHRLTFGERLITVPTWPVLLFSVKGRIYLTRLWRNIIL